MNKTIPLVIAAAALLCLVLILSLRGRAHRRQEETATAASSVTEASSYVDERGEEFWKGAPDIDAQLLTPNEYSRPQIPLSEISAIIVHYTANPGSTAQQNRDFFEGLADGAEGTRVSSHFVIGLDGEIIQCIPSSEISYASNDANTYSLAIECCHPDESGEFTQATYDSLVKLVGWLCRAFEVPKEGILRHYDITGKICPKDFVDHPEKWTQFTEDAWEYRLSIGE